MTLASPLHGGPRGPEFSRMSGPHQLSSCTDRDGADMSRKSSRKITALREKSRDVAAALVEQAFPGRSENEICEIAAPVLECHPSTIRNILRRRTALILPLLILYVTTKGIDALEAIGADE